MKFYARDLKENTIFEVTSALDAVSMFDTPRTTIEHFLKYKTPRLVDRRFLINKTKEALYPKYIVCKPEELLMTLKVTRRDVRTLVQTVAFENTTPKRYHDIISVLPGQLSGTALYTAYLIGRVRIGEEISILINGYRYLLTVQYPTQMMPVRVDNWDESVVGFRVQHIDTGHPVFTHRAGCMSLIYDAYHRHELGVSFDMTIRAITKVKSSRLQKSVQFGKFSASTIRLTPEMKARVGLEDFVAL